jgi:hypothetical protein
MYFVPCSYLPYLINLLILLLFINSYRNTHLIKISVELLINYIACWQLVCVMELHLEIVSMRWR